MENDKDIIRVRGKIKKVKSIFIDEKQFIFTGNKIVYAKLKEEWDEDIDDPEYIVEVLKKNEYKADILTFMQRLPHSQPKFDYYYEWDSVAALPITSYDDWFHNQLQRNPRNKIKSAEKKGVCIKQLNFDETLAEGIHKILNETPIRQGKPFYDYGLDLPSVIKFYSTFIDRAHFFGAYYQDELIGYMKLVRTDNFIRTMGILCLAEHRSKSPMNLLMASAVKFCAQQCVPYLVYAKYSYGKIGSDTLMDFKKYNGFEGIILPRYYVPLTNKGKLALKLNLHQGLLGFIPKKTVRILLDVRNKWYSKDKYKHPE